MCLLLQSLQLRAGFYFGILVFRSLSNPEVAYKVRVQVLLLHSVKVPKLRALWFKRTKLHVKLSARKRVLKFGECR